MVRDQLQLLYGIAMDRGHLRMVMKHWILSGIASSPARAFICTRKTTPLSQESPAGTRHSSQQQRSQSSRSEGKLSRAPLKISQESRCTQFKIECFMTSHCMGDADVPILKCNYGVILGYLVITRDHDSTSVLGDNLDIVLIPGYNITVLWVLCTMHGLVQKTNAPFETCHQI